MQQCAEILLFIFISMLEVHSIPFQLHLKVNLNDFGSSNEQKVDRAQTNGGVMEGSVENSIQNPAVAESVRQYLMANTHLYKYFDSEEPEPVPSPYTIDDTIDDTVIIDEGCKSKPNRFSPEILTNTDGVRKYILRIGNLTQSVWTEKCDTEKNTNAQCPTNTKGGYKNPKCVEEFKRISLLTINIQANVSHNFGVNIEFDDFYIANGCVCKATKLQ